MGDEDRSVTPTCSIIAESNGDTKPEAVVATVQVTIVNTGPVAGDEVLLLFIKPPLSAVALGAPNQQLAAFDRFSLNPGESATRQIDIKQAHVWSILPRQARAMASTLGDWQVVTSADEDKGLRLTVAASRHVH